MKNDDALSTARPQLCLSIQEQWGDSWVHVCAAAPLKPTGALLVAPPAVLARPGPAPSGFRLVMGTVDGVTGGWVLTAPVTRVHVSEPDLNGNRHVAAELDLSGLAASVGTEAGVEERSAATGSRAETTTDESAGQLHAAHAWLAAVQQTAVGPSAAWLARAEDVLRDQLSKDIYAGPSPVVRGASTHSAASWRRLGVLFPALAGLGSSRPGPVPVPGPGPVPVPGKPEHPSPDQSWPCYLIPCH
jgi:hypothetical protein